MPNTTRHVVGFQSGLSVDAQGHIIAAEFAVAAPEEPVP